MLGRIAAAVGGAAAAAAGWGWFEGGWVRYRRLELAIPRLPQALDGLRIAHLSDFHLGLPSRGAHAVRAAVDWAAAGRFDLTLVTGDLVTRPPGEEELGRLLPRLRHCYAILGNHDFAVARDPFAEPTELPDITPATLLSDDGRFVELRGEQVWIAGVDPRSRGFEPDLSRPASLRILLSHYPSVLDRLRPGSFELVLAGHMHDGQICIPYPGGKLRLAHPRAEFTAGLYERDGTVMHVSPGLGTTFVPFRFFARPEATELVLHSA